MEYDVFISYRQQDPDLTWVRTFLLPRLEAADLSVMIDYKHFRLGRPLVAEMERAVLESRTTLLVATPTYFESTFTQFENLLSQHFELKNPDHQLLVLMREPCELSLRLEYKVWLTMTSDEEVEANLPRLIEAVREAPQ